MIVLAVYYGERERWHSPTLDAVQKTIGFTCAGFDGLQADFEFKSEEDAQEAFLRVRAEGFKAECGALGSGPSAESLDKARRVMKRSYTRKKSRT